MKGLFEAFGIDLKILISQIINFFIVFFVVYKFLINPINGIIEERKKKINEGLKIREDSERLIKKIKNIRKKIIQKAYEKKQMMEEEIEKLRQERIQQVLNEIEELRKDLYNKIEKEKVQLQRKLHKELENESTKLMLKLAEKIFGKEELNEKFILKILKNE